MLSEEEIKALSSIGEGYNVDFKLRVPAKVRELSQEVCSFANSEGGYVLIGIDDSGQIVGTEIDNSKRSAIQDAIRDISPSLKVDIYQVEVEGRTVWVLDVPMGKDRPYVLSGSIYVRESANSQKLTTAEEIRSFFQRANKIFFDAIPCADFNFDKEFDEDNFNTFCIESGISKNVSTHQILENLQVFDKSEEIKNGGVMFFAKHPENLFPQVITRCVLFKGTTRVHIIDDKTYGGSLYNQYLQAEAWIKDKLKVAYLIEGMGPRKEIWEIPLEVFKEALINALAHRDYYEQGANTMVEIYDNRVEISNPGGLLSEVAENFGRKSASRNPLIFGLFTRMHLVERVASGIPRMREAMSKAGLPEPIFETKGFFTITFSRVSHITEKIVNKKTLTNREKAIVEAIKGDNKITYDELCQQLSIARATLSLSIKELQNSGILERAGSKKNGYWILKSEL